MKGDRSAYPRCFCEDAPSPSPFGTNGEVGEAGKPQPEGAGGAGDWSAPSRQVSQNRVRGQAEP